MAEYGTSETVPLLLHLDIDESSRATEDLLGAEPVPCSALISVAGWESRNLWRLSWASIVIQVFNFMMSLVTQMFISHLGSLELAGASIANVGIQGLAYGIMLGMASAVQTECGQAYGAKKYRVMGIVCQRALILHLAAAFLIAFLYAYAGSILRAMQISSEIAAIAQVFTHGLLPQLLAFALYCPLQRFLQAHNIVNPIAYILVGVFLPHILLTLLAVYKLGCGVFGAALTLGLSWWVLTLATWVYILVSPSCKQTWSGLSKKAFTGLWPYLNLTIASAVMLWYQSILQAELWAILEGLLLAWKFGYKCVHVESDSLTATQLIQNATPLTHAFRRTITDCQELISRNWKCKLHHIYREANSAVDAIIKNVLSTDLEMVIYNDMPNIVAPFVNLDCNMTPHHRTVLL